RRFSLSKGCRFPWCTGRDGKPARVDEVPDASVRKEDVLELSHFVSPWVALRNPRLGIAVALTWDPAVFRYVWCWQMFGGRVTSPYFGRGYALALEPSTSPVMALEQCAAQKECPVVAGGGTLVSFVEASIHDATASVREIRPGGVVVYAS
ncbi:MAG TPA: hypothetical protein VE621_13190, partial [Bryobacteraceae bacterium]|nr:hypothetical protein [Bryobacteraceae bacterium]